MENYECYILGFNNASEKPLEENNTEKINLTSVTPCTFTVNAYQSYLNGYKDGLKLRNTLIKIYTENRIGDSPY